MCLKLPFILLMSSCEVFSEFLSILWCHLPVCCSRPPPGAPGTCREPCWLVGGGRTRWPSPPTLWLCRKHQTTSISLYSARRLQVPHTSHVRSSNMSGLDVALLTFELRYVVLIFILREKSSSCAQRELMYHLFLFFSSLLWDMQHVFLVLFTAGA